MNMIKLFKDLDEKTTKIKAKSILKTTANLELMVSGSFEPKVTQTFSLELKTFGGGAESNALEEHLARQDEAREELEYIYQAINSLNAEDRHLIHLKFIDHDAKPDYVLTNELGYSDTQFYRLLDLALIRFAYAYKKRDLVTYKN